MPDPHHLWEFRNRWYFGPDEEDPILDEIEPVVKAFIVDCDGFATCHILYFPKRSLKTVEWRKYTGRYGKAVDDLTLSKSEQSHRCSIRNRGLFLQSSATNFSF